MWSTCGSWTELHFELLSLHYDLVLHFDVCHFLRTNIYLHCAPILVYSTNRIFRINLCSTNGLYVKPYLLNWHYARTKWTRFRNLTLHDLEEALGIPRLVFWQGVRNWKTFVKYRFAYRHMVESELCKSRAIFATYMLRTAIEKSQAFNCATVSNTAYSHWRETRQFQTVPRRFKS